MFLLTNTGTIVTSSLTSILIKYRRFSGAFDLYITVLIALESVECSENNTMLLLLQFGALFIQYLTSTLKNLTHLSALCFICILSAAESKINGPIGVDNLCWKGMRLFQERKDN